MKYILLLTQITFILSMDLFQPKENGLEDLANPERIRFESEIGNFLENRPRHPSPNRVRPHGNGPKKLGLKLNPNNDSTENTSKSQDDNNYKDSPHPSRNKFRPQIDNEDLPHPDHNLEDLAHPFHDPSSSAVHFINKCKWVDGHPCPKSSYVCWNRALDKEFSVEKPEGNVCWVCLGDQCICEGTKENGKCEKWLQDIRKCEKCEDKQ